MIYGSTKTKLDHIIDNGLRRIDEAVEGVIAKHPKPLTSCQETTKRMFAEFGEAMNEHKDELWPTERDAKDLYQGLYSKGNQDLQRRYNHQISAMVEDAVVSGSSAMFVDLYSSEPIKHIPHKDIQL